jgi:hypothetical protein
MSCQRVDAVAIAERQPVGEVPGVGGPGVALVPKQEGGQQLPYPVDAGRLDSGRRADLS